MRWLAIWLFLTVAWFAGWALAHVVFDGGASGSGWRFTRETTLHMIAVPLAQVAALWGVSRFRRMFRDPP